MYYSGTFTGGYGMNKIILNILSEFKIHNIFDFLSFLFAGLLSYLIYEGRSIPEELIYFSAFSFFLSVLFALLNLSFVERKKGKHPFDD